MRANSPSSFVASLALHLFVAAVIFVTTIYVAQIGKTQPVIFELVAGPPTAPDELFAPALGNTAAPVKLDIPKVELPPEPQVEEVAPPPATPPAVKETPKAPPVSKPKADTSIAKEMKKQSKMSYKEYLRTHPTPKQTATATAPRKSGAVPRIDAQGIAEGVRGGSTANTRGGGGGKALTREEQNEFDTYISRLVQELKRAHEPPPGVSDQLEAKVTFDITASGAIMNPRIAKSSGNAEFDESVLEAFRKVRSIGPTPNRKSDTWSVLFRMKDE